MLPRFALVAWPRPIYVEAMKRPPWKVALIAFGVTIVVGLVVGLIATNVVNPGGDAFERGQRFGTGLGYFAVFVAVVAFLIARRRERRAAQAARDEAERRPPI